MHVQHLIRNVGLLLLTTVGTGGEISYTPEKSPPIGAVSQLEKRGSVKFSGEPWKIGDVSKNVSAIDTIGSFLLLGVDEGTQLLLLSEKGPGEYAARKQGYDLLSGKWVDFPEEFGEEIDVEGIASVDNTVYVVGSHSAKRSKVKPAKKKYATNRDRLASISPEPGRQRIFKLQINSTTGEITERIEKSLWPAITDSSYLAPFAGIPSKENGIDIEGIAADSDTVYIGFRGPVLRMNYVPIMVAEFDSLGEPDYKPDIRFVNLDGRGIRDMTKVADGFLLIGGPVAELGTFELYHWNGQDAVTGTDRKVRPVVRLGEIPTTGGAKPEGILVVDDAAGYYDILIVYDSAKKGDPTVFRALKPALAH